MDAICKEGLSRKCVFAPNFLVNRGKIKGYETFTVYFVRKNRFPNKSIQPLSIGDVKILLPTWKVGKASIYKLVGFFCLFVYVIDEIPAIFSKMKHGTRPKFAHAYYVFPLRTKDCS